jgi:hypothetical protein
MGYEDVGQIKLAKDFELFLMPSYIRSKLHYDLMRENGKRKCEKFYVTL